MCAKHRHEKLHNKVVCLIRPVFLHFLQNFEQTAYNAVLLLFVAAAQILYKPDQNILDILYAFGFDRFGGRLLDRVCGSCFDAVCRLCISYV